MLELGKLKDVGAIGLAFLLARATGKIAGAALGVKWIGPGHRVSKNLGLAMLCQAGVAIGVGRYLLGHWGRTVDGQFQADPGAEFINTIILASVVVFELTGPLVTKRTVVRAGEVKAVSLLSRPAGSLSQLNTIILRLCRALMPGKKARDAAQPGRLTSRHIMRTNIESLTDTAKMSEVLRFVEHSRLGHFYVVDNEGHFVGSIDFKDLRNLVFNPALNAMLTAYDMANTAPPVALAGQPLPEVLRTFHDHDVGSLPVIENPESRRFLGVIEQRDVIRALHVREDDEYDGAEH
jgi:CBS domain-containing protein